MHKENALHLLYSGMLCSVGGEVMSALVCGTSQPLHVVQDDGS